MIPESKVPLISVVIPCYNSGEYLGDALASIRAYPNQEVYEVLIVDDGSTDEQTKTFLAQLPKSQYHVIYQENKGPAGARNAGVRAAKGEYILFLDSDNKIRPAYIDRGLEVFQTNPEVGVVYGKATFFGNTTEVQFTPRPFDMIKMLSLNYIDMCSVVRKQVWEELGGLDEDRRLIGHEDWEFWLRVGAAGWKFAYLNEVLFDYRVRDGSVIKQAAQEEKKNLMLQYVHSKHWKLYLDNFRMLERQVDAYKYDQANPTRAFLKYTYTKYFKGNRNSR